MEVTRQHVVDVLHQTGLDQGEAEELAASLPETVDLEEVARLLLPYGITKDELISRMGGSP